MPALKSGALLGALLGPLLLTGIATTVRASDFPKRQAGLWEIQSEVSRAAGLAPAQQCVGPNSDTAREHLDRTIGRRGYCDLSPFTRNENNVWIAQSTCRHRRKVVITRKIATGDFLTNYRIDTIVRSRRKRRTRTLVQDILQARYLGPCLAGQRPGDLITPGMGTLNMTDGAFQRERGK